jgi:BirA family biotin operon repressor/biotin-[acetyl-CoA-carboxylase] ligase
MVQQPLLPARPVAVVAFDALDSTSSEATRRARAGEAGPLWIRAGEQTAGRGRSGRAWASPAGNLYATLLFEPGCAPADVPQLSFVAGVAVHDMVSGVAPLAGLRLKWPNDVLIGQANVAGILAESLLGGGGAPVALLGIGLNLASAPATPGLRATHLAAHGAALAAANALSLLDNAICHWLAVWDRGKGFAEVREAWLQRAGPLGEALTINSGEGPVAGRFAGLDAGGALLLVDLKGNERRFTFGDVAVAPPLAGA